ncbi:MAG: hypothetical protein WBG92_06300 [Thiohalocapsa sp.]
MRDNTPLKSLRMAFNQDQPIGNDRFSVEIEMMTGQRRILRKRGDRESRGRMIPGQKTGSASYPYEFIEPDPNGTKISVSD